MNAQTTYPTTTQMSFLLRSTVLPVAMLATKLMAARTSRKIALRTTTSTAKAAKRDAKPA